MRNVRLTETNVQGQFRGNDGGLYDQVVGTESRCERCGRWAQTLYRRRSKHRVCDRHVQFVSRARIRLTTTFACRMSAIGASECPPALVLRRGDELAVAGRPEPVGQFDRFPLPDGQGFALVPRSRWAWV